MRIAAALLACALVLAGCGSESSGSADGPGEGLNPEPKASGTSGAVIGIVINDGKVTPQGKRVKVEVGAPVTLKISSDADEEIHVHSDPEHEYEVGAGESITESFTIDTPGQVAVEAHHLDVTIVQLVVSP
jgi:hypothetical protein